MPIPFEIVAVDDASSDRSPEILDATRLRVPFTVRHHAANRGKGGAVQTGVAAATGDFCVVFDADPEYDATDIPKLVNAYLSHSIDAVYGTRSFGGHSAFSFWYVMGNKAVTTFANLL